jgi:murein DD-endopeptidase MepM/ murein hydrolase activator NlpD
VAKKELNLQPHILLTKSILVFSLACSAFAADPPDRFQKVVDRLIEAYNQEDYAGMAQDFSEDMSKALPPEKSTPIFRDLRTRCGKVTKLDDPKMNSPSEAVFPVQFESAALDLKIVLDDKDKIAGLWFLPHSPTVPVPEKHETILLLPFEGKWTVFWGGDTKELNRHHDTPNQRYAFDFLVADAAGKTCQGDGNKNEDYYAFGRKVFAPADGVVTDVIEGVRDNQPRSMNPFSALGNAVIIEHRDHEVSALAHFKNGSITVKPGDKIKKGRLLGLCGNSGNSSEPHIHYHLQNTPIIQDGTGIKCYFENVVVAKPEKATTEKHYSPVKGDVVSRNAK